MHGEIKLSLFKTNSRLRKLDAAKNYKLEMSVSKALANARKNQCLLVKSNQLCGYMFGQQYSTKNSVAQRK